MTLLQAGAVLFVFTALAGLRWAIRRAGPARTFGWLGTRDLDCAAPPLRRTARVHLTPQHTLHQVETAQGERYLLATHPGGVAVVSAVVSASHLPQAAHTKGQPA